MRRLMLSALCLSGCLGSSSGNVEIGMVSAQTYVPQNLKMNDDGDDVVGIEVIVTEIDARVNGKWVPIGTQRQTIDLMKLDGQVFTSLGVTKLPSGKVDKLHIKLDEVGDYVVLKSGAKKPLEVPKDGDIDVTGKLDLDSCMTGIVIVDFDPHLKREDEGDRKEWELAPAAHIKTEELAGKCGPDGGSGGGSDGGSGGHDGGGSCTGVVCPAGDVCVNGSCVTDPCKNVLCPTGEVCVNGVCTTANPCSGVTCPPGEVCSNGTCIAQSPTPDMGGHCTHH